MRHFILGIVLGSVLTTAAGIAQQSDFVPYSGNGYRLPRADGFAPYGGTNYGQPRPDGFIPYRGPAYGQPPC
jgi:hypothetical protein